MGIIHFILDEKGDAGSSTGQYAFNKESFRHLSQVIVLTPTGTANITLSFQTQGELYTHDVITLQIKAPYKTVVIQKLIEDLCKEGTTTIRQNDDYTAEKGVYKHISDISYSAST